MTRLDIDAALAAANPLTTPAAAALPLQAAEAELVERIVAQPAAPAARPRHVGSLAPSRRRLALVLAATAVVAAALALLPSGERTGGPAPAFAAALVRFANNSPLVLLPLAGWHVVYAYEQPGGYGEMHFVRGPADANGTPRGASFHNEASIAGRVASLTWQPVTPATRKYVAGGHESAPTGLGVTARRFVGEGSSSRWVDVSAFFVFRGRELDFRATVPSMSAFYTELRALRAVDTNTWLRAMPPSVINSADSARVIREMLKGIPLPRGFNANRIQGARLVQNRYDLGTAVTGTIACLWFADWYRARHDGDRTEVNRAIAAMATAPNWPVLHQMARQGAWPEVLIGYARDMRRGTWHGRPLIGELDAGLGCRELGVRLPRQRNTFTIPR